MVSSSVSAKYLAGKKSSKCVFVANFSPSYNEERLSREFGHYGKLEEVIIVRSRETNQSRGFAYITYANSADATRAVQEMNYKELDGRPVRVEYSTTETRSVRNRSSTWERRSRHSPVQSTSVRKRSSLYANKRRSRSPRIESRRRFFRSRSPRPRHHNNEKIYYPPNVEGYRGYEGYEQESRGPHPGEGGGDYHHYEPHEYHDEYQQHSNRHPPISSSPYSHSIDIGPRNNSRRHTQSHGYKNDFVPNGRAYSEAKYHHNVQEMDQPFQKPPQDYYPKSPYPDAEHFNYHSNQLMEKQKQRFYPSPPTNHRDQQSRSLPPLSLPPPPHVKDQPMGRGGGGGGERVIMYSESVPHHESAAYGLHKAFDEYNSPDNLQEPNMPSAAAESHDPRYQHTNLKNRFKGGRSMNQQIPPPPPPPPQRYPEHNAPPAVDEVREHQQQAPPPLSSYQSIDNGDNFVGSEPSRIIARISPQSQPRFNSGSFERREPSSSAFPPQQLVSQEFRSYRGSLNPEFTSSTEEGVLEGYYDCNKLGKFSSRQGRVEKTSNTLESSKSIEYPQFLNEKGFMYSEPLNTFADKADIAPRSQVLKWEQRTGSNRPTEDSLTPPIKNPYATDMFLTNCSDVAKTSFSKQTNYDSKGAHLSNTAGATYYKSSWSVTDHQPSRGAYMPPYPSATDPRKRD